MLFDYIQGKTIRLLKKNKKKKAIQFHTFPTIYKVHCTDPAMFKMHLFGVLAVMWIVQYNCFPPVI